MSTYRCQVCGHLWDDSSFFDGVKGHGCPECGSNILDRVERPKWKPHPDQQYSDDQLRYTVERIVRDGIGLGGTYSWTGPTNRILELIAAREQRLLDRIADEVIKEDESYNTSPKSLKSPLIKIRYRNELRKQQRARLAAIRSKL